MADAHRCDACRHKTARCADCRAARAAVVRARNARKRAEGICTQCTRKALDGETLCKAHRARNRIASRESHALARAEGRE